MTWALGLSGEVQRTNNNDPLQQFASHSKRNKESSCSCKWSHKAPVPGESVEGSSHKTSFRFQQETEQLRTGKHEGALVQTCLYTTLEAPNHDINVPNWDVIMEAHARRLNQGFYAIG